MLMWSSKFFLGILIQWDILIFVDEIYVEDYTSASDAENPEAFPPSSVLNLNLKKKSIDEDCYFLNITKL